MKDWSETPLGPIERWPQSLRTSLQLVLNAQRPAWLSWGREQAVLYNDAALRMLARGQHPDALGRPAAEVWASIWEVCGPLAQRAVDEGAASIVNELRVLARRTELVDESFYSLSLSPVADETGRIRGVHGVAVEVTDQVVSARRLRLLGELAAKSLVKRTIATGGASAIETIAAFPEEVPFALLYLAHPLGPRAVLAQSCGVLRRPPEEMGWAIADVLRQGRSRTLSLGPVDWLPRAVADEPIGEALLLPLVDPHQGRARGVLVVGVSPARKLDAAYRSFLELLASQVTTAIYSHAIVPPHWEPEDLAMAEAPTPPEEAAVSCVGARIILSSPDPELRARISRALAPHWEVEAVEDADAALAAARRQFPDLVLDHVTTELAERPFVRALRGERALCAVPVLVLSDHESTDPTGDEAGSDANDYLVRPFVMRQLIARVSTQLHLSLLRTSSADEHAQLYSLFQETPAPIAVLREPGHIYELANAAFKRMVEKSDLVGKAAFSLFPEFIEQGFKKLLDDVLRTGEPFIGRAVPVKFVRRPNGQIEQAYFDMAYQPLRGPSGRVERIMALGYDVTKQVHALWAIERLNHRHRALLSALASIVWTSDANGGFVEPQPEFEKYTGQAWAQHRGYGWVEMIHPADRAQLHQAWVDAIRARRSYELRGRLFSKTAQAYRHFVARAVPIIDDDGVAREWIGHIADIEDQERGEAALKRLVETERTARLEAERAVRFNEMFAGMLGHDLRNPLSAIVSSADYLQRPKLSPEKVVVTAARIASSSARMNRMIDQLLDFTRIRTGGGIPLTLDQVNLPVLCERVREELDIAHPERKIELRSEGDCRLEADADRLLQVLSNLAGNAIHHGAPEAPVRIEIDGTEADELMVGVWNAGTIPREIVPSLFEAFRGTKTRGSKGLGLGLYISEQLIKAHGGRIAVTSSGDEGTLFELRLPRRQPRVVS